MSDGLDRRLREAVGTRTYRHLGELTRTHHETVRRYMQGQTPSASFLANLCEELGLNANWLLNGHGPMHRADLRTTELQNAEASELFKGIAAHFDECRERLGRVEQAIQGLHQWTRSVEARLGGSDAKGESPNSGNGNTPPRARRLTDPRPGSNDPPRPD